MNTKLKRHLWLVEAVILYLSVAALTVCNVPSWATQSPQVEDRVQNQPASAVPAPSVSPTANLTSNQPTSSAPPLPPHQGETGQVLDEQPHVFQSPPVQDFPATALGQQLSIHLDLMASQEPGTEDRYQDSLDTLRQHPEEATTLLANAYKQMTEERYIDRWKVVETLTALQSRHALAALTEVAQTLIPAEPASDGANVSSNEQEMMIRESAIRGLMDLSRGGVLEAEGILSDLVDTSDGTVRAIATLAYLQAGENYEQRVSELQTRLAPEEQWMLQLEPIADPGLLSQVSAVDE